MKQVTYSPAEFAALFNRSQTWGYRQIYAQKVKTITEYGRIMIPASEVDRILATAGVYGEMKRNKPTTKEELQKTVPAIGNAWLRYVENCRVAGAGSGRGRSHSDGTAKGKWRGDERNAALRRLRGKSARGNG